MKTPRALQVCLMALLLAGCAVGPDFVPPKAPGNPDAAIAVDSPVSGFAGESGAQRPGQHALAKAWWREFSPPQIDSWVREALEANPDLRTARLALARGRDVLSAETGLTWWPSVDLNIGSGRQRSLNLPGLRPPTVLYDTYGASVGASYVIDLFGGERRGLEAAAADVDATSAETDMARLAVAANVVSIGIQASALRARIDTAQAAQDSLSELAELEKQSGDLGRGTPSTFAAARRQVARQAQSLPALRSALRRQRSALAALMGRTPERAPEAIAFDQWHLPQDLPTAVRSEVLKERPDIAMAIARLHAATARYGAAIANLYPQIQITAAWGREAYQYEDLLHGPMAIWHVIGGLTQPLFRGGALEAAKRAAGTDREMALASYVGTVLQALRSVADAQQSIIEDGLAAGQARDAADASAQIEHMDAERERSGSKPHRLVLADHAQWLNDEDARIVADAARLVDTVAYLQSLSGPAVLVP